MLGVGALPMASVGGRWMLPDAYGELLSHLT